MPTWNGTRADLIRSISLIPAVLRGEHPDPAFLRDLFWNHVANELLELIQFSYREKMKGRPSRDGQVWVALTRHTLKRKQPASPWKKTDILAETGDLFDSLAPGVVGEKSTAANQVNDLIPGGLLLGSNDSKADAHQDGDPDTNLPARPFIPGDVPFQWEASVETAMQNGMKAVVEAMVEQRGID